MKIKKKVLVGMSGGVDSSVAAALLLEEGFEVIGATLKIWESDDTIKFVEGGCCSLSSVDDARNIADKLDIPYYVLNFKNNFRSKVIDYFINEYICGRTPNPCIACNKFIKFQDLMKKAVSMGIDYIATGHYANIEEINGKYYLKKAYDEKKDQTYVLYNFNQEQLKRTIFPLGIYKKNDVRKIADKFDLAVSNKKESQEICFIEDNNYIKFIKNNSNLETKKGNFTDVEGNVIGKHEGIINYTIGQRKGLGSTFGEKMYVVSIDKKKNEITLGKNKDIFKTLLTAKDVNFVSKDFSSINLKAKIRYNAKEAKIKNISLKNDTLEIEFHKPQRAITPGQSVVVYDGDLVLGGGIIDNVS